MTKKSLAARLVRVGVVAGLLGASVLIPLRPSAANASLCGSPGYGHGGIPVVDSVAPNTGSTVELTTVTVTGCGFTGSWGPFISLYFGSTMARSLRVDSDTQITSTAPLHSAGTVDVTVTTPLGTSPAQPGDRYTYVAPTRCLSVTLTASPPGQVVSGTQVTFTANASSCLDPNPLYEFMIMPSSSLAWTIVQPYSTNNVFVWDTSRQDAAIITVWAKDSNSVTSTFDVFAELSSMLYSPQCSAASLTAAPTPPQKAGTQVVFTANAGCFDPTPLFAFWIRPAASSTWTLARSYSATNTFTWDTSGLSGLYYIGLWAKDVNSSTSTFDSNAAVTYTVKAVTCTGVTLTAAPQSPQIAGSLITLTANATGCADPSPLYVFWIRPPSSSWMPLSPVSPGPQGCLCGPANPLYPVYMTTNVFVWNTSHSGGQYSIGVWAKDAESKTGTFDINAAISFTVNPASCAAVTLAAVPTTVMHGAGASSVVTAMASGCTSANPLYEFWVRPATSTVWTDMQPFSTSNVFKWDLSASPPGTYYVGVWVKDVNSGTDNFDAVQAITVTVT